MTFPPITVEDTIAFMLVMSRIGALMMAFPFFNTTMIPRMVKIFILIGFSFYLMKLTHVTITVASLDWIRLVLLLLKEFLIGFLLALLTNIFIAAFSYAAEIVSYFMGFTVANSFDPTYGQVSVMSRFFLMLFYLLFFVTDAHLYFFASLATSLKVLPIEELSFHQGVWQFLVEYSKELFVLAFKLAFPFALILYLINLSLALINRLIPQINVFIVGLPLQIFVGLAALTFGTGVIIYMGSSFLASLMQKYLYLLQNMG